MGNIGGEGGIRTPVTVPRELDFESREDQRDRQTPAKPNRKRAPLSPLFCR